MVKIYRGTTPTIKIKIPGISNISIVNMWLSFKSKDYVKTFEYKQVRYHSEVDAVSVTLSQEDTLAFNPGEIDIQVRVLDTNELGYSTPKLKARVLDIIQDGVLDMLEPTLNSTALLGTAVLGNMILGLY